MISVRNAELHDSKDLFDWRNDAHTRQMFRNSSSIEWDDHVRWFEHTLRRTDRALFICYCHDEKIGSVRFDIDALAAEVSINIAPNQRGKGFAEQCLRKAISHLRGLAPQISKIIAEVKVENLASQKTFEAAGFSLEREGEEFKHYTLHVT